MRKRERYGLAPIGTAPSTKGRACQLDMAGNGLHSTVIDVYAVSAAARQVGMTRNLDITTLGAN